MNARTTTKPQDAASAAQTAKHDCCGGESKAENAVPKPVDHDHHEHAAPSKPTEPSCCCGSKG